MNLYIFQIPHTVDFAADGNFLLGQIGERQACAADADSLAADDRKIDFLAPVHEQLDAAVHKRFALPAQFNKAFFELFQRSKKIFQSNHPPSYTIAARPQI